MLTAIPKPAPPAARELAKVDTVTELIGNTPLVEIRSVARGLSPGVRVLAKLEGFNPGGSVKDRAALRMIREAVRTGQLRPGQTIIESTSGNTGIAIAMIGATLGYPVRLVLPSNVSEERKGIIRFLVPTSYTAIQWKGPMGPFDSAARSSVRNREPISNLISTSTP